MVSQDVPLNYCAGDFCSVPCEVGEVFPDLLYWVTLGCWAGKNLILCTLSANASLKCGAGSLHLAKCRLEPMGPRKLGRVCHLYVAEVGPCIWLRGQGFSGIQVARMSAPLECGSAMGEVVFFFSLWPHYFIFGISVVHLLILL